MGLKYVISKEGVEASIRSVDQVTVHYTLWVDNDKKLIRIMTEISLLNLL
ncbi:MAG: hypothetical protein ACMUEM_05440 [Flavobacteriales bacterium AspAUS03]